MTVINAIVTAREFAVRAHGGQKYGDQPYVVHLDEVAEIALQAALGLERDMVVVASVVTIAYLHDVLEDTNVLQDEISRKFGAPAAACAELLSDPPGKNRKERKEALYARLAILDPAGFIGCATLLVKASDRLANLRRSAGLHGGDPNRSLMKMYLEEAPAFRRAVHRPGLCERVWREIDQICPV
jgi:guanosine-3',5'-bis(diphosphate) 3'-pyrophosphohydrolase